MDKSDPGDGVRAWQSIRTYRSVTVRAASRRLDGEGKQAGVGVPESAKNWGNNFWKGLAEANRGGLTGCDWGAKRKGWRMRLVGWRRGNLGEGRSEFAAWASSAAFQRRGG